MHELDVDAAERAEAQIDEFIRRRAREKQEEDTIERLWAQSRDRERERRREENRLAWCEFYERLSIAHEEIAAANRAKAEALLLEENE